MRQLTAQHLKRLFPNLSQAKASAYAPHFAAAVEEAQINTRARLCAFVAQLGHESQDLAHLKEIWGPTSAQARYDVRTDLGNTPERDGDGKLYMGRGGLQRTGKKNYLRFKQATGVDVIAHPELLERPDYAFQSDALYWTDTKLNRIADQLTLRGDAKDLAKFDEITKTINGGYNGRVERQRRYLVAIATLPEELFNPEPAPQTENPKSALDRVNDHVNNRVNDTVNTTPVATLPNSQPSDGGEKSATAKILIEKLGQKEGTKAVARSLSRRLAEPVALLVSALAAGNIKAWLATGGVVLAAAIIIYRERHAIAAKFDRAVKVVTDLI